MNIVFAAPDDETAIARLGDLLPGSPTHNDDGLRPEVLADLETHLTGRNAQDIAADPRHCAQITQIFDEGAGVTEAALLTITDTLTHALAAADAETLSTAAASYSDYTVEGLATVARHATAHSHHMYTFWYF